MDVVGASLGAGIKSRSVDILLFNPPYVVSYDQEVEKAGTGLDAALVGGIDGRRIINQIIPLVDEYLSPLGTYDQ